MTHRGARKRFRLAVVFIIVAVGVVAGQRNVMSTAAVSAPLEQPPREDVASPSSSASAPSAAVDFELVNPGFEGGWDHTPTDVYNAYGHYLYTSPFGEIFVPEGWNAFFRHGPPVAHDDKNDVGWAQPEVHVINNVPPFLDPPRVFEGQRALKLFTFWKIHDAGLYQQLQVPPGVRWRLYGWVHAWTSDEDDPDQSTGDPIQAWLMVGMDPTGGTSPYSETIVWGEPGHIYDVFAETPALEVTPQGDALTVFIRSWVLWPYKHNDVYWDAITLHPVYTGTLPALTADPMDGMAFQGQNISYTLSLSTAPEVTVPMTLSAGTIPGAMSAFYPTVVEPGDTATLVVTPSLTTPAGTHVATVEAAGTLEKDGLRYPIASTTQVSLTVQPADYALDVTPAAAAVLRGGTASFVIQLGSATPGFSAPVALGVTDVPSDSLSSIVPAMLNAGTQATLTITTTKSTPVAAHELVITGTAGELERTAGATLEVRIGTFLPLLIRH
jgi:hypothetical protein